MIKETDTTYKNDFEFVHLGAQLPEKYNISLIEKIKYKKVCKQYMKNLTVEKEINEYLDKNNIN